MVSQSKDINLFVNTRVKLNFERRFFDYSKKMLTKAAKNGTTLSEDLYVSFVKGIKEGKISISPKKVKRLQ